MNNSLFTDGACRGNPGKCGAGYLIKLENEILFEGSEYIGVGTNNYAEYVALIKGLTKCISMDISELSVYMDSLVIVNQVNGKFKVKNKNMVELHSEVLDLIANFEHITFTHVLRHLNKAADKLANRGIDNYIYTY